MEKQIVSPDLPNLSPSDLRDKLQQYGFQVLEENDNIWAVGLPGQAEPLFFIPRQVDVIPALVLRHIIKILGPDRPL